MVNRDTSQVTALDLLRDFLELRALTPDVGDWTEERLCANPPRVYRLRRLVALFRAFEIPWGPAGFASGQFIRIDDKRYSPLVSRFLSALPKAARRSQTASHVDLADCFQILFTYREIVDKVMSFSGGVMEASGLQLFAYLKTEELTRIVREGVPVIESVLAAIVSPEASAFTIQQLVRDYEYPAVDLSEIDEAWL